MICADGRPDPTGRREALSNQVLSLLTELAGRLSPRSAEIATRNRAIERLHEEIAQAEMDLAHLRSWAATAAADGELWERWRQREKARRQRLEQLGEHRLMLMEVLERARAGAGPRLRPLYAELDRLVARLREL